MALYVRNLTSEERRQLDQLLHSGDGTHLARRAYVVLLSARKLRVHEISRTVGLHPINVRKWIHRFNERGLAGILPRHSPGRPRVFDERQRRAIVEMATSDPDALGLAFSTWSLQRLRSKLIERGVVPEISAETIRQELLHSGMVFEGRRWVPASFSTDAR